MPIAQGLQSPANDSQSSSRVRVLRGPCEHCKALRKRCVYPARGAITCTNCTRWNVACNRFPRRRRRGRRGLPSSSSVNQNTEDSSVDGSEDEHQDVLPRALHLLGEIANELEHRVADPDSTNSSRASSSRGRASQTSQPDNTAVQLFTRARELIRHATASGAVSPDLISTSQLEISSNYHRRAFLRQGQVDDGFYASFTDAPTAVDDAQILPTSDGTISPVPSTSEVSMDDDSQGEQSPVSQNPLGLLAEASLQNPRPYEIPGIDPEIAGVDPQFVIRANRLRSGRSSGAPMFQGLSTSDTTASPLFISTPPVVPSMNNGQPEVQFPGTALSLDTHFELDTESPGSSTYRPEWLITYFQPLIESPIYGEQPLTVEATRSAYASDHVLPASIPQLSEYSSVSGQEHLYWENVHSAHPSYGVAADLRTSMDNAFHATSESEVERGRERERERDVGYAPREAFDTPPARPSFDELRSATKARTSSSRGLRVEADHLVARSRIESSPPTAKRGRSSPNEALADDMSDAASDSTIRVNRRRPKPSVSFRDLMVGLNPSHPTPSSTAGTSSLISSILDQPVDDPRSDD